MKSAATIRPMGNQRSESSATDTASAITAEKRALRIRMRALRDAIPPEQRAALSARICERAIASPAYQSARLIHCFLSIRSEIETRLLIEHALAHGKRVAAPLFVKGSSETAAFEIEALNDDHYETDSFGLAVPRSPRLIDLRTIDVFFVPLLAFAPVPCSGDQEGADSEVKFSRLGYGIAYYDRLLVQQPRIPRIGLAFEVQRLEALPVDAKDQLLDCVLTEQ